MFTDPIKEVLHISRHWNNPEIQVTLYREGIAIEVSLEDFCKAVVAEIPNPAWVFSREKLQANVLAALSTVLNKVKESSNHI
jgi:hypothetical protein